MNSAVSEPVRLKASTEILDRAGVRGGIELDGNINVTDGRSAADIISERLGRLASGAVHVAAQLATAGIEIEDAQEVPQTNDGQDKEDTTDAEHNE
jgi:hypothetical protein